MKVTSHKTALSISVILLGFVWCIAMLAISWLFFSVSGCFGAIIGGIISVAAALLYLQVFHTAPDKQATEIEATAVYITVAYLGISGIVNTLFVLLRQGGFNIMLIAVNLLIDAAFVIAAIYVEMYIARTVRRLIVSENRVNTVEVISRKIGTLVGFAENEEIRKQLLKLKEVVDYSSNISAAHTHELENEMEAQLNRIMELMENTSDPQTIQKQIGAAEIIWKQRCNTGSSMR